MEKIWLSPPHMGGKEHIYVSEAFSTNWVAPLGPNVDAFEKQLEAYLHTKGVLSLSSGTAAIHLGLQILGVKAGDIVLCQSFTFAASAFPINYLQAVPVFIDSEKETWNMDPQLLKTAIEKYIALNKKPAAIIVVHLYGTPAKMDEILEIAKHYSIPVIEDAAEALGSLYKGKPCGSLGEIGVLSFNGNKIITTSGGGAFASNDEKLVQKARHLSAQAKEPAPFYLHEEIGFNYRMSNLCAGVGRGQMEVLDERIKRRREIFNIYKEQLAEFDGVIFPEQPLDCFCNRWLTTILFDKSVWPAGTNEKIRKALEKENIESRPLWKPLHQQPVFESADFIGNGVSDELFETGLCIPSGTALTEQDLERVVLQIKKTLNEIR